MDQIQNGFNGLKVFILGRRRPGTTLAEHRQHIRYVHGEQVLKYITTDPENAPRGYIQNRVFDSCYSSGLLERDPLALPRDFVTQVVFENVEALLRSRQTDFYRNELLEDEGRFVDQDTVLMLAGRPETLLDNGVPGGACKLIVLMRKMGPQASIVPDVCRHVRNTILPGPAGEPLVAMVEEYWFHDEDAARAGLGVLRAQGYLDEGHSAALLVWEDTLA